jgi:hypothetical protein
MSSVQGSAAATAVPAAISAAAALPGEQPANGALIDPALVGDRGAMSEKQLTTAVVGNRLSGASGVMIAANTTDRSVLMMGQVNLLSGPARAALEMFVSNRPAGDQKAAEIRAALANPQAGIRAEFEVRTDPETGGEMLVVTSAKVREPAAINAGGAGGAGGAVRGNVAETGAPIITIRPGPNTVQVALTAIGEVRTRLQSAERATEAAAPFIFRDKVTVSAALTADIRTVTRSLPAGSPARALAINQLTALKEQVDAGGDESAVGLRQQRVTILAQLQTSLGVQSAQTALAPASPQTLVSAQTAMASLGMALSANVNHPQVEALGARFEAIGERLGPPNARRVLNAEETRAVLADLRTLTRDIRETFVPR